MLHRHFVRLLVVLAASVMSFVLPLSNAAWGQAQTIASTSSASVVPGLVRFSGTIKDAQGKALSGTAGLTFALYKDQEGGAALWQETQNVTLDANGRYTVQLGSTLPGGLPLEVFASGEARWLGVQVAGQAEQPRVLLMSVPYALKAADAETVGGLPASAFMLAVPVVASSSSTGAASGTTATNSSSGSSAPPTVGGGGTANFISLWTDNANLGNSVLFQSGSGSTAKIGINTTTPGATLDVKGGGTIRGTLNLPSQGTANATKGFNSQPITLVGSAFNSGTSKAVNQTFAWQTQPIANNTSTPSGALNLLYSSGTSALANTGLSIASNGTLTFAAGQTFPGAGTITGITPGTDLTGGGTSGNVTLNLDTTKVVTGVTAGTDLTGGGSSGNVTLSLDTTKVVTGVLAGTDLTGGGTSGTVTLGLDTTKVVTGVTAGTGLTGGGTGGVPTLSIDASKVPQLSSANTFNNSQTVNGNVTVTGSVAASIFDIGGSVFAFGNYTQENAFLGFAGTTTASGNNNTATGISSLGSLTSGSNNTAIGAFALAINSNGQANVATGQQALYSNSTGYYNTAIGTDALLSNTTSSNNTATGYQALLFSTTGFSNTTNGAQSLFNTTTGDSNTATGQMALYSNTTGRGNTANGTTALYYSVGSYNSGLGYTAGPDRLAPSLTNSTAIGAYADVSLSNAMVLGSINGVNGATASTNVGIGTTAPASTLDVESNGAGLVAPIFLLKNNAAVQSGTFGNSVDFRFALDGGSSVSNPNAYIRAAEDGNSQYGSFMSFATMADGGSGSGPLERMRVTSGGLVGINTAFPDSLLTVNGSADKPGGGSWGTYSDRRLKTVGGGFNAGLSEILKLSPVHYRYKEENALGIRDHDDHVGFVAQDVQKVIPEAVTENNKGYLLVNNDPILWAMLNAIKEQQGQIREQRKLIRTQQRQLALLSGEVKVLKAAQRTNDHGEKSLTAVRSGDKNHRSSNQAKALRTIPEPASQYGLE
jgi:hypothetical protein